VSQSKDIKTMIKSMQRFQIRRSERGTADNQPAPTPAADALDIGVRSRSSKLLVSGLLLCGVTLMGVGLYSLQSGERTDADLFYWLIFISGLVLFAAGSLAVSQSKWLVWLERQSQGLKGLLGIQSRQAPCLIISFVAVIIATEAAGFGPLMRSPWLAVTSWIVGIVFALLGSWDIKEGSGKIKINWKPILLFALFVFIGFLVRGLNTAQIPHVLSGDEADSGLGSVDFIQGKKNNIFSVGWYSFPALFYFLQSISIRLIGQNTEALRLFSALSGALTVGVIYLLARTMFDEWTGLAAAIFITGFHFHINFSRIGLNNIWDGLWFALTLGLLWQSWRSERRSYFLWAGLAMGFSQYFYVSARMIPVIAIAWITLVSLLDFAHFKRVWINFAFTFFVALIVYLPLGLFFLNYPAEFMSPLNRVSIFGRWMEDTIRITGKSFWALILEQLSAGFRGFAHTPLRVWYEPGTPLLRPYAAIAFFMGLISLAVKPKDDRFLLLGIWVIAGGLSISFSESAPAAQRFVSVVPAVAILVGVGIAQFFLQMGKIWPRLSRLLMLASLLAALAISLDEMRFYFFNYAPTSQFGGDHTLIAQDLADLLQKRGSEWKVLFFGRPEMGYQSIMSLPYLAPHIQGADFSSASDLPPDLRMIGDHLILVFLNQHENDLRFVLSKYPGGILREVHRRYPAEGVVYRSYELNFEGAP